MTDLASRTLGGGRYRLLSPVGAGGAGAVYRAHDCLLDRTVAVKLLRPGHDAAARARLRAEAQIAAGLSHPGIAHVLDYGEEMVDGEPSPYLVMQYVEGVTLREVLRGGPLPPARVADLVAQLASALASAHAAGVVHRDVKPANIMLAPMGRAVLVDFGVARQADTDPLTLTGTIVGTVDYISPEQAAGEGATPRSDLYALGMVAHEAVTGARALARPTQVATLLAHVTEDVAPLPADVPAELRGLVAQMVRRDPSQRPADAAAVARRAQAVARGDLPARGVVRIDTRRPGRRIPRSDHLLVAVGVAALVLALLGAVLMRGNALEASKTATAAKPRQTLVPGAVIAPTATSPAPRDPAPDRTGNPGSEPASGVLTPGSSAAVQAATTVRPAASSRHTPPGARHGKARHGKGKRHGKGHHHGRGPGRPNPRALLDHRLTDWTAGTQPDRGRDAPSGQPLWSASRAGGPAGDQSRTVWAGPLLPMPTT